MFFFTTKKATTVAPTQKGEHIKSSVIPTDKPDFNTWAKQFKVSSMYAYHTPMPHEGVVLQQN